MMILIYRDECIASISDKEELELILNRPMFINITKEQSRDLYIRDDIENISNNYIERFRLSIVAKNLIITNIEYNILDILYRNSNSINKKYSFYNYLFTHPLFKIPDIDEYIRYRNILDNMSELDREYNRIIGTI